MTDFASLLEEALEAWGYTRSGVIAEIENLPDEAASFRPTDQSRSVLELGMHIVESGALMAGELTRSGGDFTRQSYPEHMEEHAGGIAAATSRRQLIDLLRSTHREQERRLREAGEVALLQMIRRFDGQPGTRFAWMQHGIAHEEYHRGQLALYARLYGVEPALTKLIRGA